MLWISEIRIYIEANILFLGSWMTSFNFFLLLVWLWHLNCRCVNVKMVLLYSVDACLFSKYWNSVWTCDVSVPLEYAMCWSISLEWLTAMLPSSCSWGKAWFIMHISIGFSFCCVYIRVWMCIYSFFNLFLIVWIFREKVIEFCSFPCC